MANNKLREYNKELRELNLLLEQQERLVDTIIARAATAANKEQLEYKRY